MYALGIIIGSMHFAVSLVLAMRARSIMGMLFWALIAGLFLGLTLLNLQRRK